MGMDRASGAANIPRRCAVGTRREQSLPESIDVRPQISGGRGRPSLRRRDSQLDKAVYGIRLEGLQLKPVTGGATEASHQMIGSL